MKVSILVSCLMIIVGCLGFATYSISSEVSQTELLEVKNKYTRDQAEQYNVQAFNHDQDGDKHDQKEKTLLDHDCDTQEQDGEEHKNHDGDGHDEDGESHEDHDGGDDPHKD